ncbi:MAG TPA: glycosyltransferase family 2 protein [Candidatus Nanoarchaeia archaeon]|nr:glycosyltransferase family 2 protein [Candidatus Nanoarchaeia archaeon]
MDGINYVYFFMFFMGIFLVNLFIILHKKNQYRLFDSPKVTKIYSVSFLVPAYNEEGNLENTVKAIIDIDYPENKKEIIIINDGSKDSTLKIAKKLEKKHSNIIVLDKKNSGKADSLNKGIEIAKGELLAVVDADSYPKRDALMKMIGHFDDNKTGAVTSRVLVKNKTNLLCRYQILDYSIIAWTRKLLDFVDSVYVTNGPLSVYRTDYVRKIGGFDPKNVTEDIEITWHLLSKGYQTRMSYSAIVHTNVPTSLKEWIKQRVRWNLGGIQTLVKYWRDMFKKRAFGFFVVPYVALSFILAVLGFILLLRYLWIKGASKVYSLFFVQNGFKYLKYINLDISFTVLLFFGITFFILAIVHYKMGFKSSEAGNKSILNILSYTLIYRPLYIIPLLLSFYKMLTGDIRWYTK